MTKDGRPIGETTARADLAAALFQDGLSSNIIVSGWAYRADCETTLAESMAQYLCLTHRIDRRSIHLSEDSKDTVGDAVFARSKIVDPNGWSKLIVVTSGYHAQRASSIFSFVFGPSYSIQFMSSPAHEKVRHEEEHRSMEAFRETFRGITAGDLPSIHERLLSSHPLYKVAT